MDHAITQESINLTSLLLACFTVTGAAFVSTLIWIGKVVARKLEDMTKQMSAISTTMTEIKEDLREDLSKHDTRIAVLETQMEKAVERRAKA